MTSIATRTRVELFARPDEEHFASFSALRENAAEQRKRCREVEARDTSILFSEQGDTVYFGDRALLLTNYSLSQFAAAAKVPMPVLARLEPATRSSVLNQTLERERRFRVGLADGDRLRCVVSPQYARTWDEQLYELIDRWLLPSGFVPAVPTDGGPNAKGNRKPFLFRGDRDSHAFFYSGDAPRDDLGDLRRGVAVWNSEVGARSLGFATFVFRSCCSNAMVWGASGVLERAARHVSSVSDLLRDFDRELRKISAAMTSEEMRFLEAAARADFVPGQDAEDAQDRLAREFGVPRKTANDAVDAVFFPENPAALTRWGVANGLSSVAKGLAFADERVRLMKVAGEVLAAV
jgi:hypothetical protein